MSVTATNCASGRLAMACAWIGPITPQPTMPNRNFSFILWFLPYVVRVSNIPPPPKKKPFNCSPASSKEPSMISRKQSRPCSQYISLKDLPREAQRREDQATRQNQETDPPDQRA